MTWICFAVDVSGTIALPQFFAAFLTGRMFRPERVLLAIFLRKPSSHRQAKPFFDGDIERFAAWTSETRLSDLFVMRDFLGLTRAWFMAIPCLDGNTRLFWGTISVNRESSLRRHRIWPRLLRAIMPFHQLYSRMFAFVRCPPLERSGERRVTMTGAMYQYQRQLPRPQKWRVSAWAAPFSRPRADG